MLQTSDISSSLHLFEFLTVEQRDGWKRETCNKYLMQLNHLTTRCPYKFGQLSITGKTNNWIKKD